MKAIKSLLAVSVLAAAGVTHAAPVGTFNVAIGGNVTQWDYTTTPYTADSGYGSFTGVGTATLDSSGLLTVDANLTLELLELGDPHPTDNLTVHSTFQGSYNAGTHVFSINDQGDFLNSVPSAGLGQETFTSCAGVACDPILLIGGVGVQHPYNVASVGSVALATGGQVNTEEWLNNGNNEYFLHFNLTPQAPAVPVPAAAWLFGSGLLGLSAARRRAA
jgi:hypothetical protein